MKAVQVGETLMKAGHCMVPASAASLTIALAMLVALAACGKPKNQPTPQQQGGVGGTSVGAGPARQARALEGQNGAESVKRAIESYFMQHGAMPRSTAELAGGAGSYSGQHYSGFTFSGSCDPNTTRFSGTITAIARDPATTPQGTVNYHSGTVSASTGWE